MTRVFRALLTFAMLAFLGLFLAGPGCSSAPASNETYLRGVYEASGEGDLVWIDFMDDTHYALWRAAPCSSTLGTDDSCGHSGSYKVSGGLDGITLTDAETGHTTDLAINVVKLAPAGAPPKSVVSLHTLGSSLTGDAGMLTGKAGTLAPGSAQPVASFTASNLTTKAPQQLLSGSAELSIGAFGECELPVKLVPLLGGLLHALEHKGIELGAEFLIVYTRDITNGGNSMELLFGGGPAFTLGEVAGLSSGALHAFAEEFGGEGGLLAGASISLDFDGTFGNITLSLDAYSGADLYAVGGGKWKVVWSQDPSEVGETGWWASVTLASAGACKAGAVVFASDSAITVLWNLITGHSTPPKKAPVCGVPSTAEADCDACLQNSCCSQAQTCSMTNGCTNLYQCLSLDTGAWGFTTGCNLGASSGAKAPAQALVSCLESCNGSCGTSVGSYVAPILP